MFSIYHLFSPSYNVSYSRTGILLCALIYPNLLEQCLVYSKRSINKYLLNDHPYRSTFPMASWSKKRWSLVPSFLS